MHPVPLTTEYASGFERQESCTPTRGISPRPAFPAAASAASAAVSGARWAA
ncbi:hypothetical protein [Streptomyces sp. NPDC093795]|uniref:hypothetical protein n=1 Tax=Streptomyces sp. NPDC093795 TaxID=3366051 RepID=UPI0037F7F3C5